MLTLLTVAFVVLKLIGVISWSWFFVFLPFIIEIVLIAAVSIFNIVLTLMFE